MSLFLKQVGKSQNKEISSPLTEISYFGKTREPAEASRPGGESDDDEHEEEEDHHTVVDESLSKPKKKRKGNKRKTQGKRQT